MTAHELQLMAAVLRDQRDALLTRWREQARQLPSAKGLDTLALEDHVPKVIDELAAELETAPDAPMTDVAAKETAPLHAMQRYENDFDIVEVVAEYNILRCCIHTLAEDNSISLRGRSLRVVNRVIDESIALAVQSFSARQALEAQRRRDEYLAFLAHDLRTPIGAISQAMRTIEMVLPADQGNRVGRMLAIVRRNGKHLEELVEHMLKESAHLDTDERLCVEWRRFDLWPVVEAVIHDLQPVADTAGTRLSNTVPEGLQVVADASLLKRAIQNLVANAITYAPHGEVVVSARAAGANGDVECCVSDNGTGIPEDQLETIFKKGATDHRKEGAMGLGLAIVKAVVEAHGGRVGVESRHGAGSTFRITLPGRKAPAL